VFLAREPFFLRGRNNFTVPDEASGAIVVICRNAQYVH